METTKKEVFKIWDMGGYHLSVDIERSIEYEGYIFVIHKSLFTGKQKIFSYDNGEMFYLTMDYDTKPFVASHKESGLLITLQGSDSVEYAAAFLRDKLRSNWKEISKALAPYRINSNIIPAKKDLTKQELEHLYKTSTFPEIAKKLGLTYPPQLYALLDKYDIPRKSKRSK